MHELASWVVDTDALRWFSQVADGVTVTEVSELEQVTQSGVSRALARLESEVGTPLLRRSGRTLRMTHAGAAFKRHVAETVASANARKAVRCVLHRPPLQRCHLPARRCGCGTNSIARNEAGPTRQ